MPRSSRARVIGLTPVGVAALGLVLLRVAGSHPIVVPGSARAGDLTLAPCRYPTENGDYEADCGTVIVRERRSNPRSRLIALPVTRIRARGGTGGDPIFRLGGGPGSSNLRFAVASRFAARHDVVLVGYRGADGSAILDCPEVTRALARSRDLLAIASLAAYAEAFAACARRLRDDGIDLAGYTLTERVEDLEAVRRALGYDRLHLVSQSAGTRTALVYAWRHPERINRSVMIGANPPGHFLWSSDANQEQFRRYARLCAEDESCRARTANLVDTMAHTARNIPGRWGPLLIKRGNVQLASFFGLAESSPSAAPMSGPITIDSWLSAASGDASGFWLQSLLADLIVPRGFIWGEAASIGRTDNVFAERYFSSGPDRVDTILGNAGTVFIWGGGRLVTTWPQAPDADDYSHMRPTDVETLVIGGTLDFATPPQGATAELMPSLARGSQVVLTDMGHAVDFWSYQPEASTRLVEAFLETGRVDESLYARQRVDFDQSMRLPRLAKLVVGSIVGFATLALLSLCLLWWWSGVHGRPGPIAGVLLRSVYAAALGLGGWLAGVLVVLATAPGLRPDSLALVVFASAVPVALAVCRTAVGPGRARHNRSRTFVLTVGSALIGGCLGALATEGLLAPVTVIVGAVGGANVPFLTLDLS